MAQFKVGDRVRRKWNASHQIPVGSTGTIHGFMHIGIWPDECFISWDDPAIDAKWHRFSFLQETLEPLVPPSVDEWASEQVKKWTKLEPQPEKLPTLAEVLEDYYHVGRVLRVPK